MVPFVINMVWIFIIVDEVSAPILLFSQLDLDVRSVTYAKSSKHTASFGLITATDKYWFMALINFIEGIDGWLCLRLESP